jgi:hypothetical protein
MPLPTLTGLIRRRILVNFRLKPELIQPMLPAPFRPVLVDGWAIAGICLIRLEQVRPKGFPSLFGLASENAAHRLAVAWLDSDGTEREGVYIFRRESNNRLNHAVGGRLFPGVYHPGRFTITEDDDQLAFRLDSHDGAVDLHLLAAPATELEPSSIFPSVGAASAFFRRGAAGYSPARNGERAEGMHLTIPDWSARPLHLKELRSAFYQDGRHFPEGAAIYDCTLLMTKIAHEWQSLRDIPACCTA